MTILSATLSVLAALASGLAVEITAKKWDFSGSARLVATVVVTLIVLSVGLTIGGELSAAKNPSAPDPLVTTARPIPTDTARPTPTDTARPIPTAEPQARIAKYWSGKFLLNQVSGGVDLDTKPASSATGAADNLDAGDLFYDNQDALGNLLYAGNGPLAQWEGERLPDAADCIEAVQTLAIRKVDPSVGQILCVGTSGGRIARLEITRAEYEDVRFSLIVWNVKP